MKVKAEIDINVRMGGSAVGTSCQGYFPDGTTYADLVRIFGEPQIQGSDDGKIQIEWVGFVNGIQFTIYDYKSPVDFTQNTDWHIGGRFPIVASLLLIYFNSQKSLDVLCV